MAAASARRLLAAAAFLALALPAVLCQKGAPAPAAAKAGPPNVTAILEKGGQFATFMRLMKSTQQDTQLNSQLNNSFGGYTVLAPTDNAFNSLKPGTLNKLSQQEQVSLVQYHILPQFYSLDSFETASNPVRTQASGSDGPYTLNITADSNNQVNVSTGIVATSVGTALNSSQPLAVYSVDKVLLPNDLFGAKPPASAPPAPAKKPSKGSSSSSVAEAPAGASDTTPSGAAAGGARVAGWSVAALLLGAAATSLL